MTNDQEIDHGIPFQVEHLIKSMLNKGDNLYVRGNFKTRLMHLQEVIDKAIKSYDSEIAGTSIASFSKKRKRR
jgi:hypothetical protein